MEKLSIVVLKNKVDLFIRILVNPNGRKGLTTMIRSTVGQP